MQNQTIGDVMFPRPNAVTLLADDHERVRRLLGEFARCRDQNETALCRQLAGVICDELAVHLTLKEEMFYPAARQVGAHPMLVDEAEIEHEVLRTLIERVRQGRPDDSKWYATMAVLGRYLRLHTDDEERELFWLMRRSGADLEALGERMRLRREELAAPRGLSHPDSAKALPA